MARIGGRVRTLSLISVLIVTIVGVFFGVQSSRPSALQPSAVGSARTLAPSPVVDPAAEAVQVKLNRSLQNMLDSVLGPENSVVVTTVELGPSASSSIPNPAVAGLESSQPETELDDEVTRNNAINQVDEIRSSAPEPITRLDVVVRILSGSSDFDPAQIEQLVSAAAGIDPSRGDKITVTIASR
ncbi:hypothetical protein M1L60_40550 [Actinoplanes sp. TRM 88003]|uniref:Flagellar M-ring C-terminal domain-containing protein n=1 Tax=Paractinoplanes aksuensis TaxID=2939490 RepID=A0ABT1E175_9ACTN|nr:flagellar M-ring protein FliF C-terminal domain-containing protein [Actinoplanes aksuensis]MCO8276890.1 hypothetical protein [Actinoplanes aksuensis]